MRWDGVAAGDELPMCHLREMCLKQFANRILQCLPLRYCSLFLPAKEEIARLSAV